MEGKKTTKHFRYLKWRVPCTLRRLFWGWVFHVFLYISRIHTAYIGEDSSISGTWNLWWNQILKHWALPKHWKNRCMMKVANKGWFTPLVNQGLGPQLKQPMIGNMFRKKIPSCEQKQNANPSWWFSIVWKAFPGSFLFSPRCAKPRNLETWGLAPFIAGTGPHQRTANEVMKRLERLPMNFDSNCSWTWLFFFFHI